MDYNEVLAQLVITFKGRLIIRVDYILTRVFTIVLYGFLIFFCKIFYLYLGSAPPSVHGSRIDLSTATNTGSAIYLGFSQPRNTYTSGSTWSISKVASSGGSGPPTPINTPPVSPRHGSKRYQS